MSSMPLDGGWTMAEQETHSPSQSPMRAILENFADVTTVHGVPKIIKSRSNVARLFWVVICVGASSMFITQMTEVLTRYFRFDKKVTVEVVAEPVPFPSISICNMRNLDPHILNIINRAFIDDRQPLHHYQHHQRAICEGVHEDHRHVRPLVVQQRISDQVPAHIQGTLLTNVILL